MARLVFSADDPAKTLLFNARSITLESLYMNQRGADDAGTAFGGEAPGAEARSARVHERV